MEKNQKVNFTEEQKEFIEAWINNDVKAMEELSAKHSSNFMNLDEQKTMDPKPADEHKELNKSNCKGSCDSIKKLKKEHKTLAYFMGQLFAFVVASCVLAILISLTIKFIMYII